MLKNLINSNKYEKYFGIMFFLSCLISAGVSYGKIYLFHITIVPVTVYLFLNKSSRSKLKSILTNRLNLAFISILLILIISAFWAVSYKAALLYIIQYIFGITIILFSQVFLHNREQFTYYVKKVLFPFFLFLTCFGLLEASTSVRWPISAYSDFNELFGRENLISNLREIEKIKGYSDASPAVFYWNTNHLSYLLVMFVPFIAKWKLKNLLLLVPTLIVLFFSGSKIIIMILLLSFLIYSIKDRLKLLFIPFIFALMASCILIAPDSILAVKTNEVWVSITNINIRNPSDGNLLQEELASDLDKSSSGAMRKELFLYDLQLLKASNFIGIGAGSVEIRNKEISYKTNNITSTHNYWLEITLAGGALVGLIYIFILYSLGKHYLNKITSTNLEVFQVLFLLTLGVISVSSCHYFIPFYLVLGFIISPISGKYPIQNLLDE